jgi:hypothetical protein
MSMSAYTIRALDAAGKVADVCTFTLDGGLDADDGIAKAQIRKALAAVHMSRVWLKASLLKGLRTTGTYDAPASEQNAPTVARESKASVADAEDSAADKARHDEEEAAAALAAALDATTEASWTLALQAVPVPKRALARVVCEAAAAQANLEALAAQAAAALAAAQASLKAATAEAEAGRETTEAGTLMLMGMGLDAEALLAARTEALARLQEQARAAFAPATAEAEADHTEAAHILAEEHATR